MHGGGSRGGGRRSGDMERFLGAVGAGGDGFGGGLGRQDTLEGCFVRNKRLIESDETTIPDRTAVTHVLSFTLNHDVFTCAPIVRSGVEAF